MANLFINSKLQLNCQLTFILVVIFMLDEKSKKACGLDRTELWSPIKSQLINKKKNIFSFFRPWFSDVMLDTYFRPKTATYQLI